MRVFNKKIRPSQECFPEGKMLELELQGEYELFRDRRERRNSLEERPVRL